MHGPNIHTCSPTARRSRDVNSNQRQRTRPTHTDPWSCHWAKQVTWHYRSAVIAAYLSGMSVSATSVDKYIRLYHEHTCHFMQSWLSISKTIDSWIWSISFVLHTVFSEMECTHEVGLCWFVCCVSVCYR